MASLTTVVFFSLIGGIFSLAGGLLLLSRKRLAEGVARYAAPFAGGALLAAAFLDLLKEGTHENSSDTVLTATLAGLLLFFLLERFLHWFHHHHQHNDKKTDPRAALVIIGDTVHNFLDGIAIAASFLVGVPTGIVTTLAVAAHEIPQEIGDFGLLLSKGYDRRRVIMINVLSALATTMAATIFFLLGTEFALPRGIMLGLVAGFFIYIAVSDLIPTIHKAEEKRLAGIQTLLLLTGVIVVGAVTQWAHAYIEPEEVRDEQNHIDYLDGSRHDAE